MTTRTHDPKPMGCTKSSPKKEVSSKLILPQEKRKISNNLTLQLKQLEKEQTKPKLSRRKEITKIRAEGFPGGTVVENLPANAGDVGSSPGLGRSHMLRSNSAREPQLLSLRVWSLCSATRGCDSERPAHRDEEWPLHHDEEWPPLATTSEKALTQKRRPNTAIHTYIHTYIKRM